MLRPPPPRCLTPAEEDQDSGHLWHSGRRRPLIVSRRGRRIRVGASASASALAANVAAVSTTEGHVEPDLLAYANAFKHTFLASYKTVIETAHWDRLAYLDLLEHGHFVGYYSSSFGAGYEWRRGPGRWEVRSGTSSINRIFLPFHSGSPSKKYGVEIEGEAAAVLEHCEIGTGATVTMRDHASALVWRSRLLGNSVVNLITGDPMLFIGESELGSGPGRRFVRLAFLRGSNAPEHWSAVAGAGAAENVLLRAQVEILLDRTSRQPYQHLAKNSVLLLGDFSGEGRARLRAIEEIVRRLGWSPVYVDKFDDIPRQDIRAKVLTLASICRFVLVDDSSKAGQLTEIPLLEQARTPSAILRKTGSYSSAMTRGIGGSYSLLRTYTYNDEDVAGVVETAANEAEAMVRVLEQELDEEYKAWRASPPQGDGPKWGLSPRVRPPFVHHA